MVRFFEKPGKKEEANSNNALAVKEESEDQVQSKEESQSQVVEREINLSLLNEKLNILLNLVSQLVGEKKN